MGSIERFDDLIIGSGIGGGAAPERIDNVKV